MEIEASGEAVVPLAGRSVLSGVARHTKSFVSLDGTHHLLSLPADARYVGKFVSAWVERYLPDPPSKEGHRHHVEAYIGLSGFPTDLVVRNKHHLRADNPMTVATEDRGSMNRDELNPACRSVYRNLPTIPVCS